MIYRVSFAQESGCRGRLDIAALAVAVEHVRARIDVSTGFRRVRLAALRLARTGSERPPGGGPDRREPNAGSTGLPQGGTRSGGKSADGHDPSGSIASVDVHSCVRSDTWVTMRRSGHGRQTRRRRTSSEEHRQRSAGKEGTVAQSSGLSGSASSSERALRPDASFGRLGAKEGRQRFVIQALAGQEFETTAGRKLRFFGAAATNRAGLQDGG